MEETTVVLLRELLDLIKEFRAAKPEERGEMARRYAVTITELEKVAAYFAFFCRDRMLLDVTTM